MSISWPQPATLHRHCHAHHGLQHWVIIFTSSCTCFRSRYTSDCFLHTGAIFILVTAKDCVTMCSCCSLSPFKTGGPWYSISSVWTQLLTRHLPFVSPFPFSIRDCFHTEAPSATLPLELYRLNMVFLLQLSTSVQGEISCSMAGPLILLTSSAFSHLGPR